MIKLILLVFALVCFALAALPMTQPPSPYHARLVAAGLAFLTAAMIPWPVT